MKINYTKIIQVFETINWFFIIIIDFNLYPIHKHKCPMLLIMIIHSVYIYKYVIHTRSAFHLSSLFYPISIFSATIGSDYVNIHTIFSKLFNLLTYVYVVRRLS